MRKILYGFLVFLLTLGFVAGSAMATSYDPTGQGGALMTPPPTPMLWNHGKMGDALFGEAYRAISEDINFVSYFTIQNTSNYWVAAHVRLRAGRYSIEAYDFPILLSPKDVFWMQFEALPEGGVQLYSGDTNTLMHSALPVPFMTTLDDMLLDDFEYLIDDMGWTELDILNETTQGHIEVFGLFSFMYPSRTLPPGVSFPSIMGGFYGRAMTENATCPVRINILGNPPTGQYPGNIESLDVGNYLTGQVFLGDFASGTYMGYTMRAIQNFRSAPGTLEGPTDPTVPLAFHRDEFIRGTLMPAGTILYGSYPSDSAYTDPDWATSWGPTWNDGDDFINTGHDAYDIRDAQATPQIQWAQSFSLDEVDDAIIKQELWSPYFNDGFSGQTYTMAALTFPTKYLHFFFNQQSGLRNFIGTPLVGLIGGIYSIPNAWPVGDEVTAFDIRRQLDVAEYVRRVTLRGNLWDTQEIPFYEGDSPYPPQWLPWEVNFIPIGLASYNRLLDFCFLVHADADLDGFLAADPVPFYSGQFVFTDFQVSGGDPRNLSINSNTAFANQTPLEQSDYGAMRYYLGSMLEYLNLVNGLSDIIPASMVVADWEDTNYDHSRMYDPAWNNPAFISPE